MARGETGNRSGNTSGISSPPEGGRILLTAAASVGNRSAHRPRCLPGVGAFRSLQQEWATGVGFGCPTSYAALCDVSAFIEQDSAHCALGTDAKTAMIAKMFPKSLNIPFSFYRRDFHATLPRLRTRRVSQPYFACLAISLCSAARAWASSAAWLSDLLSESQC